jgi:hypothetical protein
MNPGDFYAQGSAQFVAGAAIGNAVGTAVGQAATYKDCMMASGYTPRDPQTQANVDTAVSKIRPIMAQTFACLSALYGASDTEPIRRHISFNPAEATSDQLSDRSYATDQEISVIITYYPRLHECQQNALTPLSITMPSIVPLLSAQYAKGAEDITSLQERKLTWVDFSTRRRARAIETQGQLTTELRKSGQ